MKRGVSYYNHSLCVIFSQSVRLLAFSYKRHHLLNQWTKFKIVGPLSKLFKEFISIENFGCHGIRKKEKYQNLKNLLVQKYRSDLKIILHKCSLVEPLPKLFKSFWSNEKHGHSALWLVFLIFIYCENFKYLLEKKYKPDLKII